MSAINNQNWSLESFVDSLVVALDKTRETLAVKSINKPLSYTVKDMSLELQIFPTFDGDDVSFRTAQPGQEGSSKISLQLASITDQQVRATSKSPPGKQDIKLDAVDLDPQTKKQLRRLGVTSVGDLEQIEKKDVDIGKVSDGAVDYKNLANLIQKARRTKTPPKVKGVSLSASEGEPTTLVIRGENLSLSDQHTPVAVLNGEIGDVMFHANDEITVSLGERSLQAVNDLILTLDPYCVVRLQVRNS